MFERKKVREILSQAERMDSNYKIFGASTHHYKLNPPVEKEFVRKIGEKYQFSLPQDYVQFITEIGDGGAGPDYGIYSFGNILRKGKTSRIEEYYEEYRYSLGRKFVPEPLVLKPDEAQLLEENFEFDREAYEKNPEKYFYYVSENDLCDTDGFLHLGSCGGRWEFGLITCGERYGQIFDTDNEGIFRFAAYCFHAFYQSWLDHIADTENFLKELKFWRKEE